MGGADDQRRRCTDRHRPDRGPEDQLKPERGEQLRKFVTSEAARSETGLALEGAVAADLEMLRDLPELRILDLEKSLAIRGAKIA